MSNNFYSHVNADKKKWIMVAVCFVLVGVILCAIMTSGFQDWNPYGWFGNEEDIVGSDSNDTALVAGKTYAMASNMVYTQSNATPMSTSTSDTTAVQLVATITPDYATNQSVTWAVDWVDDSATWASGKDADDYISAEPISSGSKTATVTCLAPFGEQIAITVTSVDNPDASATCVCDYQEQLVSFEFEVLRADNFSATTELDWDFAYKGHIVDGSVVTTAGTLGYTYTHYFELQYGVDANLTSALSGASIGHGAYGGILNMTEPAPGSGIETLVSFGINFACNACQSNSITDDAMNTVQNAIYNSASTALTFSHTMDGITETVVLSIDKDTLAIAVESLTLDQYSITF